MACMDFMWLNKRVNRRGQVNKAATSVQLLLYQYSHKENTQWSHVNACYAVILSAVETSSQLLRSAHTSRADIMGIWSGDKPLHAYTWQCTRYAAEITLSQLHDAWIQTSWISRNNLSPQQNLFCKNGHATCRKQSLNNPITHIR